MTMHVAQITDLHLNAAGRPFGPVDTAGTVRAAISALNAFRPRLDLVIITGDLVNLGRPDEYAFARGLLDGLALPWRIIPGNHDARVAMRDALADRADFAPGSEFLQFVHDDGPLRIIGLDTVAPGGSAGGLCPWRLDWLAARLAEAPTKPTLVAMHHPPFAVGMAGMDAIGLIQGRAEFAAVIEANPQVALVTCGHVHRPVFRRFAGTIACIAPGVSHQVELELTGLKPAAFNEEPPAWLLHRFDTHGLVTHQVQIRRAPGPYRFQDLPPGQ